MKTLLIANILLLLPLLIEAPADCSTCAKQDWEYNCAANTLSMNYRLCMDMTEVSGLMYRTYLEDLSKQHGADSERQQQDMPDFDLWQQLYPDLSAAQISEKFFKEEVFALAPMVGVSYEQVVRFCEWRTRKFKEQLAGMSPKERKDFPKDFRYRLPTAKEWARIRFMVQQKGMIKQIKKIAGGNAKVYKIDKNTFLNDNEKVGQVYANQDPKLGLYNLFDNVAEMTAEEGVAMGGSWHAANTAKKWDKQFSYDQPEAWLGFRCIFEIIK